LKTLEEVVEGVPLSRSLRQDDPTLSFESWGMYHRFLEQGKDFYINHNGNIMRVVPKEKLLEFNVKQGWGPLCEFLGVEKRE
jgi:hypothetical protein